MPDPAAPSLSSCVLCGRDVDDGVAADFGGLEVEVHEECADAGLEGMDLASPHAEPDAADGDGGGGADPSVDEPAARDEESEDQTAVESTPEAQEEAHAGEVSEAEASRDGDDRGEESSRSDAGNGGGRSEDADGSGSGAGRARDPDWTRISDFT